MVLLAAMAATVVGVRARVDPAPILVVHRCASTIRSTTCCPRSCAQRASTVSTPSSSPTSTPATSTDVQLVVLAETPLTDRRSRQLLITYVNGGGRLVAMRPDTQLDVVLGITRPAGGRR